MVRERGAAARLAWAPLALSVALLAASLVVPMFFLAAVFTAVLTPLLGLFAENSAPPAAQLVAWLSATGRRGQLE